MHKEIIKEIKKNIHPNSKNKKNHKEFIDRYFPGGKAYGARNPDVRLIAKKYLKEVKDKKKLLEISDKLWEDGHIEPRLISSIFIGKCSGVVVAVALVLQTQAVVLVNLMVFVVVLDSLDLLLQERWMLAL